ncbi:MULTISPECIES: glycosyltransferase family 2 protein [Pseudomonas]|uniref:Glycosyltransferase n=1 Tax=Pseudomonas helleri TaxID=1608996 RepID=A0A7X1WVR2_9PSED|nr:glycosyltransferase [Pseudomonas helleri]MQT75616.1 glycosyltransferase [Pseudomonas helleri]
MISILITTRDRQEYIDRQITCLLRDLQNTDLISEILILDDGSEQELSVNSSNKKIKFFRSEQNLGLIEARNFLVKKSSPAVEYVFFLDDDIFIHNIELFFRKALTTLQSGYSCVTLPYINLPTYKYEKISTFKHIWDIRKTDDDSVYFFGGTSLFNKADFLTAGGLEGRYYIYLEEEDLALRMYAQQKKIMVLYGENYIAIHDQAPGKNFSERQIYLLSNRFVFHYKFIKSRALRAIFNLSYSVLYLAKTKSLSTISRSIKRYKLVQPTVQPQNIPLPTFINFLLKRYFNV